MKASSKKRILRMVVLDLLGFCVLAYLVCAQVFLRAGSGRHGKGKGRKIGRPQTTLEDIPANFLRHYPAYKNGAFNLTELARICGISRTTAYKYIGLWER